MASWPATVRLTSKSRRRRYGFWRRLHRRSSARSGNWSFHKYRVMFCAMAGNSWIREKATASLNPSQVETSLVQLSERWPANMLPLARVLEQFPLGEPALMHLLAVSSICATRLTQDPDILLWLCQPEVCLASRGYAEMAGDLRALAGDSICACGRKARQARWLGHSRAWKIITLGSAKLGNGLHWSRHAASPAAVSWLTNSCGNISRSFTRRARRTTCWMRLQASNDASS